MTREEARLAGLTRYNSGKPCRYGHEPIYSVHNYSCCECKRVREIARYAEKRAGQQPTPPRAKTASPNMTPSHLRQAAAKGSKKAASHGDGRHEHIVAEANAILALPPNPDFIARAEARIQAARAGS
jgi:hypothetical protein